MDLSIIIPARNEQFLSKTIDDILEHKKGNTEIIVGLDGQWSNPPIKDHKDVRIIYYSKSIGQRAITNQCARLSRAKYLMKVDAHCSFDDGFDVKMMKDMQDDWTMVPIMRNLHAFDWVCKNCGARRYQGPTPTSCEKCDNKTEFVKDIVWIGKTNPQSTSYCFDRNMHFQYFNEYKNKQIGDLVETMSLQGSCFMCTRDKYFELDLCDELHGSWGQQGVEVALKTWLSGGKVIVNKKTWYAHMFRTQGGDFGFPYHLSGRDVEKARQYSKDLWLNDNWHKAKHKLNWLIDKFSPIPDWEEKKPEILVKSSRPQSKGIVYYTDNRLDETIFKTVQKQILKCCEDKELISVSLKPINFGKNFVLNLERSVLTMFKQILKGIEESNSELLFLCEHDVLYAKSHFDFIPPRKDMFYYDQNRWNLDFRNGHTLFYHTMSVSMLCAYRELLLEHYRKRVELVEKNGFTLRMGYEPGGHRPPRGVDNYTRDVYWAKESSIDIRHDKNLSPNRWRKDQFRNQKPLHSWQESDGVPNWGVTKDRVGEFLNAI